MQWLFWRVHSPSSSPPSVLRDRKCSVTMLRSPHHTTISTPSSLQAAAAAAAAAASINSSRLGGTERLQTFAFRVPGFLGPKVSGRDGRMGNVDVRVDFELDLEL